ncbi:hypothetical protein [Streptomyces auratus]|uniref:Uncharacterized protein n=1 Tax=Streptomyces auratus AGR0001 TaxID=1160718 RepID=A0A8B1NI12_9ACTN|nr:hypothetical protein [Streptomyces auratus]QTZ93644.1 hypothetical protein SU9_021120 [Streptomyces auratus AGR0001]
MSQTNSWVPIATIIGSFLTAITALCTAMLSVKTTRKVAVTQARAAVTSALMEKEHAALVAFLQVCEDASDHAGHLFVSDDDTAMTAEEVMKYNKETQGQITKAFNTLQLVVSPDVEEYVITTKEALEKLIDGIHIHVEQSRAGEWQDPQEVFAHLRAYSDASRRLRYEAWVNFTGGINKDQKKNTAPERSRGRCFPDSRSR